MTDSGNILTLLNDHEVAPDLVDYYRIIQEPDVTAVVTLSGLPGEWESTNPSPTFPVVEEMVKRVSIDKQWFVRLPLIIVESILPEAERTADVLPVVLANAGVDSLMELWMVSLGESTMCWDNLSDAVAFEPMTNVGTRYITLDGGEEDEQDWGRIKIGFDVVQTRSVTGIDSTLIAVVSAGGWGFPGDTVEPDIFVFTVRMTGPRTFAGTQMGGGATLVGEFSWFSAL